MAGSERLEAIPGEPLGTCSAFQPFAPQPRDLGAIALQLPHVSRDAVVGIVTYQLRRQSRALVADRPMPVVPTPVVDCHQRAREPALGRRLPHHVLAFARLPPCVGEAEKVVRGLLAVWVCATWPLRAEVDEARLVGMQRE